MVSELELSRSCRPNRMYMAQRQLLTVSIIWLILFSLSLQIEFGVVIVNRRYTEDWEICLTMQVRVASNSEVPEGSSRYVPSLDGLAVHIRRVRKSAPPLFSATVGFIFVEDWTRVMSLNLKVLSIPKSLKVRITCLFLIGEPAA